MNRKKDYFCTTIKFIENPTQTHWMKHYPCFLPTLMCGVIENGSLWEHIGIIPLILGYS